MELHAVPRTFRPGYLGEEKQQMLSLNRRLEAYLSRVKHLEEENALLAEEIQATRRNRHGASTHREGQEEELRRARLELDHVWRDRVTTEIQVGKLAEELEVLDLQRRRESEAKMQAKTKLEQSRRELEEEQRAQTWLRERAGQLEHEMRLLVQTHQEDRAHLEAQLNRPRSTMPQRVNQTPNLLQLGREYSQRASRAWQQAAEAHEGQLARLEESLDQTRSRLTRVGQERQESQLKLQALEAEIASARDVREHLERRADQQRDTHDLEIQRLQELLEGLEAEREELGEQIDHLLMENRGLVQLKESLGLEVATYRALLDRESFKGNAPLVDQPRSLSIADAVFSPHGVKKNYQMQLLNSHKTTSVSSYRCVKEPTVTTPIDSRKPAESATWKRPSPKILQGGAVEGCRPQEVPEKVTCAEPSSGPDEQEALFTAAPGDKEVEDNRNKVGTLKEEPVVEAAVGYQLESGLSNQKSFNDEAVEHQFKTSSFTPPPLRMEEFGRLSVESHQQEEFKSAPGKEDIPELDAPVDAWVKEDCVSEQAENEQEASSGSETEATCESRPSSPDSECVSEEIVTEFNLEENISKVDAEPCRSVARTDVEDKLYPDGEEMDTWDSVIERKIDAKTGNGMKNDEEESQHAQPEDDISAKEAEHKKKEIQQGASDTQQEDNMASSQIVAQVDDGRRIVAEQEHNLISDKDEDDDEDSQNVSVSWRTELESDSYAQDNTLADTRPLIRYKSDDTDANTQASHMDESESSEGEPDRKAGETETGMWSEEKSKRFGTMEDLCEEVESELMDEDYNSGDAQTERGEDGGVTVVSEQVSGTVGKGHSGEETEELMKPTSVDEKDTLEEEFEKMARDGAHFAERPESEEMRRGMETSGKQFRQPDVAGEANTIDMLSSEAGRRTDQEGFSSRKIIDQLSDNLFLTDSAAAISQTDIAVAEKIQHEHQGAEDEPEKREEEKNFMERRADVREIQSGFIDFNNQPEREELPISEDPKSVLLVTDDQDNLQDAAEVKEARDVEATKISQGQQSQDAADHQELFGDLQHSERDVLMAAPEESQQHVVEEVVDHHEFPEAPETAEWEILEHPKEDFKMQHESGLHQETDHVPGLADEKALIQQEEPLEISPDRVSVEKEILGMKDSTDSGRGGFFSSGLKNDFWAPSLESGATFQPDDALNEAAVHTNQNQGFAHQVVWGTSESQKVVNGKSGVDGDSPKAAAAKKEREQMHVEAKQVLRRGNDLERELVHSEESELEGELWSSEE